jgi:hypothetical protein
LFQRRAVGDSWHPFRIRQATVKNGGYGPLLLNKMTIVFGVTAKTRVVFYELCIIVDILALRVKWLKSTVSFSLYMKAIMMP